MTRNTHDIVEDHFGVLEEDQIASDTPTVGYVPIATGTGTAEWGPQTGGGTTPSIVYAECNTPGNASVSIVAIDFDSFYDSSFGSIDPTTDFPVGLGLTWNDTSDHFECDDNGIWLINMNVVLTGTPANNGTIAFSTPSYGSGPSFPRTTTSVALTATVAYTVIGKTGDEFFVTQQATSGTPSLMTYCVLEIVRIGGPFDG